MICWCLLYAPSLAYTQSTTTPDPLEFSISLSRTVDQSASTATIPNGFFVHTPNDRYIASIGLNFNRSIFLPNLKRRVGLRFFALEGYGYDGGGVINGVNYAQLGYKDRYSISAQAIVFHFQYTKLPLVHPFLVFGLGHFETRVHYSYANTALAQNSFAANASDTFHQAQILPFFGAGVSFQMGRNIEVPLEISLTQNLGSGVPNVSPGLSGKRRGFDLIAPSAGILIRF